MVEMEVIQVDYATVRDTIEYRIELNLLYILALYIVYTAWVSVQYGDIFKSMHNKYFHKPKESEIQAWERNVISICTTSVINC